MNINDFIICERFSDNGEHDYFEVINKTDGSVLFSQLQIDNLRQILEEIKLLLPINSNILLSRKIEGLLNSVL